MKPAAAVGLASLLLLAIPAIPATAHAFCGFYVAPSDAPLYNDATMVALMRDGNRTVLSMSNNYRGPAGDFAMVVPVPVVLSKESVKTLPLDVFAKLEKVSAPRLVEYWEQDPCASGFGFGGLGLRGSGPGGGGYGSGSGSGGVGGYHVKIEAEFAVGEYQIVVLSAQESDGLERWLVDNGYKVPKGAAAALAPYIKEQQKFLVAKVDHSKVKLDDKGVAVLSPLRFSYESTDFKLPVRLGLLNAPGTPQDLIVYVLSKESRYEVANYANAFIPTNLEVTDATKGSFGSFYATLFDAALAKAGGKAVMTEYAWSSSTCDPCPVPPLDDRDLATLGADTLGLVSAAAYPGGLPGPAAPAAAPSKGGKVTGPAPRASGFFGGVTPMVLTRLHTRYEPATLGADLVFRAAGPVVGGRESWGAASTPSPPVVGDASVAPPALERGATASGTNNFQARYVIRHPWTGKLECKEPHRGNWGGPPGGESARPTSAAAIGLAGQTRHASLASFVTGGLDDVASWDHALANVPKPPTAAPSAAPSATAPAASAPLAPSRSAAPSGVAASAGSGAEPVAKKSCGCATPGVPSSGEGVGAIAIVLGAWLRRRSRRLAGC
jgi:MYXO-CTERM domain-containing protein